MKKLALIFPGQASQYSGMGKKLYENYSFVKDVFSEANDALGFDLKELCFSGSIEELTKTENTQPALLACSVAAYKVFDHEFGVKPDFAAGHSIGEISALTCAGAIQFSDALKIVRQRGKYMQEAVPLGYGKMAAVTNTKVEVIDNLCKDLFPNSNAVVISNYNAPAQLVISGLTKDIDKITDALKKAGANVIPLNVSAPFHSPHMEQAALRMKEELSGYKFHPFQFPVISNVNAQPYSNPDLIIDKLVQQIIAPVQWEASMKYFESQNIDVVFELGPKNVLKNLMAKNVPGMPTYSFDDKADVQEFSSLLSRFVNKCLAIAVSTRNRNHNDEEYNQGVSVLYNKVQQLVLQHEQTGEPMNMQTVTAAYKMLCSVLETKKAGEEEKQSRFSQLFEYSPIHFLVRDTSATFSH